ncbi:phage late control D family protein [Novosphingobium sp. FSY-8]|uniref:Phage late control D family protein n=1 Tax=Novosphingobium ovatum TaxID=1908523 RepID=A0ABW9XAI1_9SPHN|nr:contractile injection system protein, VgrG/Pvc8 family [Novosphingobium ovatum]NBC35531.1 phage late control D family protein [Novosphingobium ovatum]
MQPNVPAIRLTLPDGTDLASGVNPRLIEMTLSEKRGGEADTLELTLHNHDGRLPAPPKGKILKLEMGWTSGEQVAIGLINKGRFKVDEVEESGPPDKITIRARATDLGSTASRRRTRAWHDTTLGAVLTEIATRNNGTVSIHPDLAALPIASLEQNNKSDMALVQDLGRRFDALATWKDRRLVFMPMGSETTASGKTIPAATITRNAGWAWRFVAADRNAQDGAEAQYHDHATGQRKTVSTGGDNRHRLKRVYATKAEAEQAAKSAASQRARGKRTFEYDLGLADCTLRPNQRVTLSGWSDAVTATKWLIDSIETHMGASGMTQKLTFEGA